MRFCAIVLLLCSTAYVPHTLAQDSGPIPELRFEVDSGDVIFEAKTQIETFHGKTDAIEGFINLETGEIDFTVKLESIKTGNSRRDRHMRDRYLETDDFPLATFRGDQIELSQDKENNKVRAAARGMFTVHGISREVDLSGYFYRNDGRWYLKSSFTVRLPDHNISTPRFLFIRVEDEINVEVDVRLTETDS